MPSTVVHLAIAGLIAAALLEDAFSARALAIVLAVAAVPDLDTFVGLVFLGTHRAALHTLLVPLLLALVILYDTRVRDESILRRRGTRAVRVAWVAVAAYAIAGIGPDLFFNGVNLFYPVHDRFYAVTGNVFISNERGFVQTLWQPAASVRGTTNNTHFYTGVDPVRGTDPADVERIFPIARGGLQALLILASSAVLATKLWLSRKG